jgi:hypothetical protein
MLPPWLRSWPTKTSASMTRTRNPAAYAEDIVMNTGEWLLLAWLVISWCAVAFVWLLVIM